MALGCGVIELKGLKALRLGGFWHYVVHMSGLLTVRVFNPHPRKKRNRDTLKDKAFEQLPHGLLSGCLVNKAVLNIFPFTVGSRGP